MEIFYGSNNSGLLNQIVAQSLTEVQDSNSKIKVIMNNI